MRAFDRFERYGQKIYNGQDVLKNHFLHSYPIHYTKDTMDYSVVKDYQDHDYVWIVDKNIETLRTFPWHFRPTEVGIHCFPYVYKRSKRIISWDKVKLVPTKIDTEHRIEQKHICAKYDVLCGEESFNIFFIGKESDDEYQKLIKRFPNIEIAQDYYDAQNKSDTDMFWLVPNDVEVSEFFKFSYMPDDWSQQYIHVFSNGSARSKDGIILGCKYYNPTTNELQHRFYAEKKDVSIVASKPKKFPQYNFNSYEEYRKVLDNIEGDMFWWIPNDVELEENFDLSFYIDHMNQYDRHINHVFLNDKSYDGVMLFSKHCPIGKKEFEHRFIVVKKEHEVVASRPKKFDTFVVNSWSDYKRAMENTTTEMFWGIPSDVDVVKELDLYFSHHNQYDRNITHVFLNKKTYDGVVLYNVNTKLSKKEVEHRFYSKKKQWEEVYSIPKPFDVFEVETYEDYIHAKSSATTDMFWLSSPQINDYQSARDQFYISHHDIIDRNQVHVFEHDHDGISNFNGLMLVPKSIKLTENEISHRHPVNRKEHNTIMSVPAPYEYFQIDDYDEYVTALKTSRTEMFWMSSRNINTSGFDFDFVLEHSNTYDRNINHAFLHKVDDHAGCLYNGLFLCSKHSPLTQKEVEHRHLVNVKQHSVVGSFPVKYDKFIIDTYSDYLYAFTHSKTEMFWGVCSNLEDDEDFDFTLSFTHDNKYDRSINHAFLNQGFDSVNYNGYFLFSKKSPVTEKEIEHRHILNVKEWKVVASRYAQYDIHFIDTYDEYLEAMEKSVTELFFAVSRNINTDNWDFDLHFDHTNRFDRFTNHAFIHEVKGMQLYNGVFLLSKHKPVTQKEIEYRHIVDAKHWDIVASKECMYDEFVIETYGQYLDALKASDTEMFWGLSNNIDTSIFDFDYYFSHDNEYDRKINHTFLHEVNDKGYRNGLFLFSKHAPVTEKEIEHRHLVKAKNWPVVASIPVKYERFVVNNYTDYLSAMDSATTEMFWAIPSDVEVDIDFDFEMYFTHDNVFDRNTNHVFKNGKFWDGIALMSTHAPVTQQEVEHRFYANSKKHDVVASTPKPFPVYNIETYNDYLNAFDESPSNMFWGTTPNIKIREDFDMRMYIDIHNSYDRTINHAFKHSVNGKEKYNGLFLFTKHAPLTQKEIEYRTIGRRKEWDIVASGPVVYDRFTINTYNDYKKAYNMSKTEMFWIIPREVNIEPNFDFDLYFSHDQDFERSTNHVFKNGNAWDGVALVSKKSNITEREIQMRFFANKKEYNITASQPKPYDIVFISKDEKSADENFERLLNQFPDKTIHRVHGIEGIHQAHIMAAKTAETEMFYVVDADAQIVDDFNFDYYIPNYDPDSKRTVHVWKSKNPINGLIYGYGAVKLLPRELTLNMDTNKPDMTTSISPLFKVVNKISNITKFDTDEFSTWRSAFRECVKLSSRAIDGQLDEETEFRLNAWCTRGKDKPFGNAAINGANQGKKYGEYAAKNLDYLNKINDFDWLYEQFNKFKNSL
jgi:hypothetical protein